MLSKTVFICLLSVYLVQPNEAIFGLDTLLEGAAANLATQANTAAQTGFSQAITLLVNLQSNLLNATSVLSPQISTAVNNAITAAVTKAGGSQTKVINCISQYQSSLTALETSALGAIISACLNVDVTQAISVIANVSSLANNLTTAVVNVNNTVAAACPPPASGDLLGQVASAVCTVTVIGGISADLALQSMSVTGYANQATSIVNSIQTTVTNAQTCVQTQLQQLTTTGASTISPIVQCSLAP